MPQRLSKLVTDGLYKEAISLFKNHHFSSINPNKFTFPYLLKACGNLRSPSHGQMLHAHLIKTGFFSDMYSNTALIDMYMKVGLDRDALQVFDKMPEPNVASLNAAISGLLRNGDCKEAVEMFRRASFGGLRINSVTIAILISLGENLECGLQGHCWAVKLGVEAEIYVGTSLVTLYSGFGDLGCAEKVFEMVPDKSVVCYNAYLTGLLQNEVPFNVLNVFKDMMCCLDVSANSVTVVSVLSACSDLLYIQFGRQAHGFLMKSNVGFETIVGTALVDMYSKCRQWKWAYDVFEEMNSNRNLVTWNSMIGGMLLNDRIENAIELFTRLELEGLEPDSATWNSMIDGFTKLGKEVEAFIFFKIMQSRGIYPSLKSITSLLPACSSLLALRCGKEIHGYTIRTDIYKDEFICTALIDMYMKCGLSYLAQRVFDHCEIKTNNPAICNVMISGYGKLGETEPAFKIFNRMVKQKVKPNNATFNCILSLCSHTGLVEKGWQIFKMMSSDFGLSPSPDHYNRMIDLLGRSGWLDEARALLQEIVRPSASAIASLLNSSVCYSDFKMGEEMAKMLMELDPESPIPLVVLSNIYAGQERWDDAERVRKIIDGGGLKKFPGLSSIRMALTI